jgi:hypothetical protein
VLLSSVAFANFGLTRRLSGGTNGTSSSSSAHFERLLAGVEGPDSPDIELKRQTSVANNCQQCVVLLHIAIYYPVLVRPSI